MKEVGYYDNGAFKASEIMDLKHEIAGEAGEYPIVKIIEPYGYFYRGELTKGPELFVIDEYGFAYPFDTPFYEADQQDGIKEQMFPLTNEDVLGLIEGFGRSGRFNEATSSKK